MAPQESRKNFIDSQFTAEEISDLKESGLYQDYIEGSISINAIFSIVRDQAV